MSVRSVAVNSAAFLLSAISGEWRTKMARFVCEALLPESRGSKDGKAGSRNEESELLADDAASGQGVSQSRPTFNYVPISVEGKTILFFDIGTIPKLRGQSMLSKEPDTIAWINQFSEGDVFWDVGANVGVFTLYAAIKRSARVLAFEPASGNYMVLNKNIEGNGLSGRASAYCVAFNDIDLLSELNMQDTDFGASLSGFATEIDYKGDQFEPVFRQGMIGFSIDSFVEKFSPEFPNHIKIDVDGIESDILLGARQVLRDGRLKSASVELNRDLSEEIEKVVAIMESCGMYFSDKAMVARAKNTSIVNYHFYR